MNDRLTSVVSLSGVGSSDSGVVLSGQGGGGVRVVVPGRVDRVAGRGMAVGEWVVGRAGVWKVRRREGGKVSISSATRTWEAR